MRYAVGARITPPFDADRPPKQSRSLRHEARSWPVLHADVMADRLKRKWILAKRTGTLNWLSTDKQADAVHKGLQVSVVTPLMNWLFFDQISTGHVYKGSQPSANTLSTEPPTKNVGKPGWAKTGCGKARKAQIISGFT